MRGKLLIRP